jgi:hypothetical protein
MRKDALVCGCLESHVNKRIGVYYGNKKPAKANADAGLDLAPRDSTDRLGCRRLHSGTTLSIDSSHCWLTVSVGPASVGSGDCDLW